MIGDAAASSSSAPTRELSVIVICRPICAKFSSTTPQSRKYRCMIISAMSSQKRTTQSQRPILSQEELKRKLAVSNFHPDAILRGAQLTVVGGIVSTLTKDMCARTHSLNSSESATEPFAFHFRALQASRHCRSCWNCNSTCHYCTSMWSSCKVIREQRVLIWCKDTRRQSSPVVRRFHCRLEIFDMG